MDTGHNRVILHGADSVLLARYRAFVEVIWNSSGLDTRDLAVFAEVDTCLVITGLTHPIND